MTVPELFGYLLVGLSAIFFALHWHQWRDWIHAPSNSRRREFVRRQLQRRMVASALIGVVGAAITMVNQLPPNPLAMTMYLLALLLAVGVIFAIGLADMRAARQMQHEEQIEMLAAEFRKATAELPEQGNS
ncbi:hypothetical protein [Lacipirellula parvula]|uniref:Uncharacterized protein n=1 Tax=Lacipirellula parvula TaxID=2650471 RepID=A0A5K7X4L5_9BACT|nr:hypothetical protein [Lacipirellula parvula]BBO31498.1 hypothetical protein PLANPX_1110 [Lacipirellula parvula]